MLRIFTWRKLFYTTENILSNFVNFDSDEMLKYLLENNKIDIVDTQMQIEKMKKEKYLDMHNHKVWQGSNGKWFTYLDDDSKRGYSLKVRNTKEDVEAEICKYYQDKEDDPYIEEVFHEWNNQRLQYGEISKQSHARYLNDYKRYFTKDCTLCQKKIRLVTENDLEDFVKTTIHKFNMTAKTYSGMRTIIIGIFKHAKRNRHTNISITTFFGDLELSRSMFKKRMVDKESEVFSESEIKLVTDYLKCKASIRDLGLLLAFQTGLRVGELSALKQCDITQYRDKKIIHIQRTEITYKDQETKKRVCEVRESPKTEAGNRYLYIPDSAIATLDAIIELSSSQEYLFYEDGKRIRANAFNRRLTRVCDELKIKHRSMHKIRKTYGTTLIDQNVPDSLVAEQMGHKDIATTRKYYYYSNKDNDTKREQINMALSC